MTQKHRVLFVGCGQMSLGWLTAIRDHFSHRLEIAGLMDLNAGSARQRADEFQLNGVWTGDSLDTALDAVRPGVVFNCTIPEAHTATCKAALQAGCHVLVEKPLAPTVAEGRELIEAAEKAGRVLAVIQNRRYLAAGETVRRAVADGAIGRVHTLCVDFFLAPRFGGFRDAMEHPLLLDMAIHTLDTARYLTGLDAERVFCHEFNPHGSWYAHGASASAIFEMTGGAVFTYRGSWCAQGSPTSWQGAWRIVGDKGTLLWDGDDNITVERVVEPWDGSGFLQPVEKTVLTPITLAPAQLHHAGNIAEFLDALDTGAQPQTIATDNLRSLAMVEAAVTSAKTRQPVAL
jgi:predicted dehydrogenase